MTQPATQADWLVEQSQQHFQKLASLALRAEATQRMGKLAARQQFQPLPKGGISKVGHVRPTEEGIEKEAISGLIQAGKAGLRAAKSTFAGARKSGVGAVKALGQATSTGRQAAGMSHQGFRQQYGLLRMGGRGRVGALRGAEQRVKMFAPGNYRGGTGGGVTPSTGKAFTRGSAAPKAPGPGQPAVTPAAGGAPAGAPRAPAPVASAPAAPGGGKPPGTLIQQPPAGTRGPPTLMQAPPQGAASAGMPKTLATQGPIPPAGGVPKTMMAPAAPPPSAPAGGLAGAKPPPMPQGGVPGYRAPAAAAPTPPPPAAPRADMFDDAMAGAMGGGPARGISTGAAPVTPGGARAVARDAARAERSAAREAAKAERAARKGVPRGVDVDAAGAVPAAPPAAGGAAAAAPSPAAAGAAAADDAAAASPGILGRIRNINVPGPLKYAPHALIAGGGLAVGGAALGTGMALQQSGAPYRYGGGAPMPGMYAQQM